MTKLRITAAVLAMTVVGSGAGLFTHLAQGQKPPAIEKENPGPPPSVAGVRESPAARTTAPKEPATHITGVVVDEAGRPVAGARVNVTWFRKAPEDSKTAADGSFHLRIGFPTRRGETVLASADGGARQGIVRFMESFTLTHIPVRVVLKPARTMTIRVTDTKGSPVEGAAVEIPQFGYGPLAQAVTDAHGQAQFRLPADADLGPITALKPGLSFDYYERDPSTRTRRGPSAYPDPVSLTLDGARRVTIKAIDSAGRPVAGVPIGPFLLHKEGKRAEARLGGSETVLETTDAQGIAQFDWIPRRIVEPILVSGRRWQHTIVGVLTIPPSENDTEITVRVLRNTLVKGKVFLPAGTPAAGVSINAYGEATFGRGYDFTRTADDGSYAMLLQSNLIYTIALLDPRGAASALTGVMVREGVPREGLDLHMVEGALVRGRVTRESDGRPAAREPVNVEIPGAELPPEFRAGPAHRYPLPTTLWTVTDDDGHYAVRLPSGKFTLSAGYPPARAEVHITGHEEIIRDLAITGETGRARPSMTLTGSVVERTAAGKQPVARAEVQEVVTRTTGFPPAKTVADAQGRFTLLVGMRPQLLYARSPDGTLAGYLEVAPTGEVELSVSAAATVLGRVVDRDGRPVTSRRINLSMTGGAGAFEHQFLDWQLHTDKTGAFLFSGLVPGSEGRIVVPQSNDFRELKKAEVREFKVRGPEPIVLAEIIVPTDGPAK